MKTWKKGLNQLSPKKTMFKKVWNANTLKGRHEVNFQLWRAVSKEEGTAEELLEKYKRYLETMGLIK